jgi:hypothetical protein
MANKVKAGGPPAEKKEAGFLDYVPVQNWQMLSVVSSPTQPSVIRRRDGRAGQTFRYVAGADVIRTMNVVFGMRWSFEIVNTSTYNSFGQSLPEAVVVHGRIRATLPDGTEVVKEHFGTSAVKTRQKRLPHTAEYEESLLDIGSDMKAAATDALKKCASLLGVHLDVYAPEEAETVEQDRRPTPDEFKQFQALGHNVYGDEWEEKRHELVGHVTGGAAESSKDLTWLEMRTLISGMEKKLEAVTTNTENQ